jgi:hypothetical protein
VLRWYSVGSAGRRASEAVIGWRGRLIVSCSGRIALKAAMEEVLFCSFGSSCSRKFSLHKVFFLACSDVRVLTSLCSVVQSANLKAKQVREALVVLLLPPEVVDQALQKVSEFGGDVDRIANYAISLPVPEAPQLPQVECIEEHLSDVRTP